MAELSAKSAFKFSASLCSGAMEWRPQHACPSRLGPLLLFYRQKEDAMVRDLWISAPVALSASVRRACPVSLT